MTIAKDFATKAGVAFVAAAMILSAIAPAAQAQSTEDLQTMINTLLAQIASLQSQVGVSSGAGSTSGASFCPYTWTRDLKVGATGADVMKLQQFLNSDADTRVGATGAGSMGMETETFGPATAAAVSKFQVKYRAETLTPNGLMNPTGYFGASSRAKANALCVTDANPSNPTNPTTPVDEEEEEEEEMGDLSGEASLDSFELEDGDSTIEEGDTDVVVGDITVEFTDGDASISRIDVTLDGLNSNAKPWDAFETLSLWVDGEMVAEMDASDEDEYLNENAGEIRFSGLDIVAMEDESLDISVGASIQNNLDAEEITDWTLDVTSMRFFDADGVSSTETGSALPDTATFEIQTAGTDEELEISLSSSNPDSTDIVVDTDVDTNDVTIMVADLEAVDNDIEMTTVVVKVTTVATTTTNVVDDIRVVIDGESFDAEPLGATLAGGNSVASTTGNFVWYLFDIDGDVTVSEDDVVAMEVVVDLNDTNDALRYTNGTTIKAEVTSVEKAFWAAEGAEDLVANQFKGTAVGDAHTLVAEGILVPVDGFESEVDTLGQNDTIGEFTLTFDVTAVEGDFYITENAAQSVIADGVRYTVTGGAATSSDSLTSTADEDTPGVFTVREGETETFTLVVTVDPTSTGTFRVSLDEVWFSDDTDGATGAEAYLPTPVSDFRTASQAIQGA